MEYRRFGKTELRMPVLTCGGMRYQQSWQDVDPKEIDAATQENVERIVRRAVEVGINHIETARGYGSSECQLGFVLSTLPRDSILVQTKVGPHDSEDAFLKTFEVSLRNLQVDYVDLLGIHGINNMDVLDKTLKQGTLSACRKLQDRGLVRHLGFSSHGRPESIVAAIETDEFSYVNLHWYFVEQRNWQAIVAARLRDMGVFIISPSEKGGCLYDPPRKLVDLCKPLTPMGFNDLFCLSCEEVHTLSIGPARPSDFDAHLDILPLLADAHRTIAPIEQRLRGEMARCLGQDWLDHWEEGLPASTDVPGGVQLYQTLRLYNFARSLDMIDYARMRYNLLGSGGHWFPGNKVDKMAWDRLADCLSGYRFADRVPGILREAHALLNQEDKKRLSES